MSVNLTLQGYNEASGQEFYRQLIERVKSLPRVRSATVTSFLPLSLHYLGARVYPEGQEPARAASVSETMLGSVWLEGRDITHDEPFRRARAGILLVPEARGIFPGLTVEENLTVLLRDEQLRKQAYERFPILRERRKQVAGLLSGGEQQMLSLAPALADPPVVLIADEPTLGLAPLAATAVMDAILELRRAGGM